MRLQHHVMAALLAASVLAAAGQAQFSQAKRTWSRTYGGSVASQGLYDLRQLPGGKLVAAGYTGSFGGPSPFNWLLQLQQATGDVLVESASSSSQGGFTDGAAIAADGGALFLGRNVIDIFTKHDAWMVRTDPTGGTVWSQRFTSPGAGRFFLFDAAELADGSWIAVGATSVFDFPPQYAWVVRLSSTGVPLWQFRYGGGSVESARSVALSADGGFVIAGASSSSGAGSDDAWVMKLDSAGAIQWQKTFGGIDQDSAEEVVELEDGGIAVAGSSNSLTASGHAPWLLRLDSAGGLLWHRAIASDVWGDLGAVAETNDGQIIVVGRVGEPGFPSNDLWAAKFDADDGGFLWQRAYEGFTGDFGSAVLPLPGAGGFVLGGTFGWGFAEESIWLTRTNRAGDLPGCDIVRKTSFATARPTLTAQNGVAVQLHPTAQVASVGVQLAGSNADVIEVCR